MGDFDSSKYVTGIDRLLLERDYHYLSLSKKVKHQCQHCGDQSSQRTREWINRWKEEIGKLMQFNRPQAKIHFQSDSNHLLMDFSIWFQQPNRSNRSNVLIATIWFQSWPFISKDNQNRSKSIKFFNINWLFLHKLTFLII